MPKVYEYLGGILASDTNGESYTIEVHQEFAVDGDVKIPTYKILRLANGTPVQRQQDGSYIVLGFEEIQLWPAHD